jgi:hypothetical protein
MMHPFTMTVQTLGDNEAVATIFQQRSPAVPGGRPIPRERLASVTGLPFVALKDEIQEALRANHHKPAVLSQRRSIELNEASGVRLALLFKTVTALASLNAIGAMQRGIATMSEELCYYWFALCYGERADRAVRALHILYGAETLSDEGSASEVGT